MINKIKTIAKTVKNFSPHLISLSIVKTVVIAIYPFINIIFTSYLIDVLTFEYAKERIITFIALICFINALFLMIYRILDAFFEKKKAELHMNENKKIIDSLCQMHYTSLEKNYIFENIQKYKDCIDRNKTTFGYLIDLFIEVLYGITSIFISVFLLVPMFKNSRANNIDSYDIDWLVFIVVLMTIVAIIIVFLISQKLSQKWNAYTDENIKLNNLLLYFSDLVTDYKVGKDIRSFNCADFIENYATEELITKGDELQRAISKSSAKSSSMVAIIGGIIGCGIYLIVGFKGILGIFTIGKIALFTSVFMAIINSAIKSASSFGRIRIALKYTEIYNYLVSKEHKQLFGDEKVNTEKIEVEFKNVSFKYDGDSKYTLKNINLKFNTDEKIAIVGKNGSGKTTLIKLLCRLYDANEGSILINGTDISSLNKDSYLNLFSIVFQDHSVFAFTISENISANSSYDSYKLTECLEKAEIYKNISNMTRKEHTFVYKNICESGIEISGGEAQKLAIARAFYKDSPIMVFDEPTSALDPSTEMELYHNINEFIKNKIAIFISHRLSSCVFCDKIIVLDGGEIREQGTHKELLKKSNSLYKEMWEAQAKHYMVKDLN